MTCERRQVPQVMAIVLAILAILSVIAGLIMFTQPKYGLAMALPLCIGGPFIFCGGAYILGNVKTDNCCV